MRRLLTGLVVAAATAMVSVGAWAGNQEFAEQIAKTLRASGQMHDYKIGVKYQDGTAWLKGQVTNDEQAKTAASVVSQIPGVTRVVNQLTVSGAEPAAPAVTPVADLQQYQLPVERAGAKLTTYPSAQPLASSFTQSAARPVSAEEQAAAPAEASPQVLPVRHGHGVPVPVAQVPCPTPGAVGGMPGSPMPMAVSGGVARFDQPAMPCYAWPSYAAYPNYAAVTYPRQYAPSAWPFIGPFYPYPQVPLGWRKVTLEWDDGWWMLDFKD